MKQHLAFLSFSLIVFIGCSFFTPKGTQSIGDEEHAILSTVLDSIRQQANPFQTLDVYDLTSTSMNCSTLQIAFDRDSLSLGSLLYNYKEANQIQYALDIDKLPAYVVLKDTEESGPYSGFFRFTRPGISDDGRMAVVEYSSVSAPLCGSGMAAVLEKRNGSWIIIWLKMIWIS